MKLAAVVRISTTSICLAAAQVPQAFGQTLSSACASALHEGAYSGSSTLREAALTSFKTAGCLDAITAAYGAAGVPRRGDVSTLALAAIAYKSLLAARNSGGGAVGGLAGLGSGGFVMPGGVVVPGSSGGPNGGGSWSVSPRPGSPGGGVNTMPLPRMNSGGSIDATPVRP